MKGYTIGYFPGTKNSDVVSIVGTWPEEGKAFEPMSPLIIPEGPVGLLDTPLDASSIKKYLVSSMF